MMKNILKNKILYLILTLMLLFTCFINTLDINIFASAAEVNDIEQTVTIEEISKDVLGDVSIRKTEILYNLDDSADYVYVEFEGGGYAVFLKQTMEMMEYSMRGSLTYDNSISKKYYGGPGYYLIKDNNCFVDTSTNQRIQIADEELQLYSSEIRKSLLSNYNERRDLETVKTNYEIINGSQRNEEVDSEATGEKPKLDTSSLIFIPETEGTYIPNYQYFLHAPRHGWNSTGTCGAVAARILLSYHNYYSDRRIIDNEYLNGSSAIPNNNPNLCEDPMRMTSNTLGTRGQAEDGSDDANSYFAYVVNKIPRNAKTKEVRNGINSVLTDRNQEISGNIDYSIGYKTGGWFFGTLSVDTSAVKSEINAVRPAIILMQESLGGSDHYVVAYGYSNYTYPDSSETYSGFITHFGWTSSEINVWINSAWCYGYVTLNINHNHTYSEFGNINGDPCRMESRCTTCGYRTDAFVRVDANDRYVERTVQLPQNGYNYKEYMVSFATSGNKLIQTFGSKDVKLYLYDLQGNQLGYNDDSGYNFNSLISYSVSANTTYILRIEFYNPANSGSIKLGITPSDTSYSQYESIWYIEATNPGFSWTSQLNTTKVICFIPETSGTYSFTTRSGNGIDTYLYVIDPEVTTSCLFDDDSAGELQATLTTQLDRGKRYFIVVSSYTITSQSGGMGLGIRKVS